MDIRYLRYFVEVAKQGGFTRAAESLNLSQPTLSKMIRNLEQEMGVTLFDRSGRHIVVTDAGRVALTHVQKVLHSVEDLLTAVDDVANLKTGKIKIGLPPIIGSVFFPRIISGFRKRYPQIQIELIEDGAKRIEHLIEQGDIDLGVVLAPVDDSLFETHPFIHEDLAVIVHTSHDLSQRPSIQLGDLRDEPFILFQREFAIRDLIYDACVAVGFHPKVAYESSQWDLIAEMVASNMGVSILPTTICRKITNANVKTISLVAPNVRWELVVIWPKHKYVKFATRELIRCIRADAKG